MTTDMTSGQETTPGALPPGWQVTTVQITETTTYDVLVAHPAGAPADEVAAAGYEDYKDTLHPDQVFPAVVGEDQVRIDDEDHEVDADPSWDTVSHVDTVEAQRRQAWALVLQAPTAVGAR